jgi:CRISPR-associated exonuclease Cas4
MCLEEQYDIEIETGAIFYGETKRRNEVCITPKLRAIVYECTKSMHEIFKTGNIPPINKGKHCKKCSLMNICMPDSVDCTKASYYLKKLLYEETT